MAQEHTKHVRLGKYTVTSHAQNRVAQAEKNLKKADMIRNLFGNSQNSKQYIHRDGTKQYDRINKHNRTITFITAKRHHVKSIRKYHKQNERKELQKFYSRGR